MGPSVPRFEAGRTELEMTVMRLAGHRFSLVCAAFFERRLLDHLAAHAGADVTLSSLSATWGALAPDGPGAPLVPAAATDPDVSCASFPPFAARTIHVAGHDVLALRMPRADEAGSELHMPFAFLSDVLAALSGAGAFDCDPSAMDVLRTGKGCSGGRALTDEVTHFEAGVRTSADTDWLGRARAEAKAGASNCGFCGSRHGAITVAGAKR